MRVCRVRNLQKERYEGKKIRRNTQLEGELLKKYCALGTKEEAMMRQAFERFSLTARSYHRILRVARTIADLDGREKISEEHLSEAGADRRQRKGKRTCVESGMERERK